jgi:hypothetical protein
LVRAAERRLAVHDPRLREKLAKKTAKQFRLGESLELSVEMQLPSNEGLLDGGHELAAEDLAENSHGEKEIAPPRTQGCPN